MNAVEFVENFGIEYAIKILNYDPSILDDVCHLDFGETENLKQIVDAWELVESYGGLKEAKKYSSYIADISWTIHKKIEKAINLVEQCNA